jgi:KipI family sensor histidine kinase inhibitor
MHLVTDPIAAMAAAPGERIASVRPVGQKAVLAELNDQHEVLALLDHLAAHPLQGQLEVLGGAQTVLVTASSPEAAQAIRRALLTMAPPKRKPAAADLVTVDTVYDGIDIAEVAQICGLSTEAVVASHTSQTWTAAFTGFVPGFAYLLGEDTTLEVPRRSSPRTSVPAGAVSLAGHYSGVYPSSSPGGWQIIGHTDCMLWDLQKESPALLSPGTRVRFRPIRERAAVGAQKPGEEGTTPSQGDSRPGIRVLRALPQVLIQDLGRPGYAALGVSLSGALDRESLRTANRLAGNDERAAGLEIVAGGLTLEARQDLVLAVAGAPVRMSISSTSGEREAPVACPFALLEGEVLSMERAAAGFRSYLAVRGGIDAPAVLGSRSRDTLAGLGPAPLTAGDDLHVLLPRRGSVVGSPEAQRDFPSPGSTTELDVTLGPRSDWFTDDALRRLCTQSWTATQDLNRVGLRLDGQPLDRTRQGELPSEGTIPGAIQVPTNGKPVIFLADHPTTGGYPVIAVLAEGQTDKAAQIGPGDQVRFRIVHSPKDRP